jgi:hypothetical protein
VNSLLFSLAVVLSLLSAFFAQAAGKLYTARFARLHELLSLLISKTHARKKAPVILVGLGRFDNAYCVRPTKEQKELANVIIYGKTRSGKGLNIVNQSSDLAISRDCQ